MKHVLTIAGSDTCGGAGIQADLKTFSAQGTYGMSVITAVTVQNTQGVFGCQDIDPEIIKGQIDAIFTDIEVSAVKIGMVSQIPTIHAIADKLEQYQPKNVVLDPVMISKSGFDLMQPEAKEALITRLIPLAYVITPNLPEAEVITGLKINDLASMEQAARAIHKMGAKNVLIKGGHLHHVLLYRRKSGKGQNSGRSCSHRQRLHHNSHCPFSGHRQRCRPYQPFL